MKRRASRIDDNQPKIVEFLRRLGASVQPLHTIGRGCPDLLVGYGGRNFALEIKDGSKSASRRALTGDESTWRSSWRGQYAVVECEQDCLSVLGIVIDPASFDLTAQAAREVC